MSTQEPPEPSLVFDRIGRDGLIRLVRAFYRRVPNDALLGPLYPPDDLAAAEIRLRDFLLFRCGNDPTYLQTRGHPRLRARHAPFIIRTEHARRWLELMQESAREVELDSDAASVLLAFFDHSARFLVNAPETP